MKRRMIDGHMLPVLLREISTEVTLVQRQCSSQLFGRRGTMEITCARGR
jgi:hypothetical protein